MIPDFGSHVYGGDGFDTLTLALATSPVRLELSDHDGMERIVCTGFGDLIEAGTATGERMTIEGGAGVDTLTGGTGQEWLYGGAERDMMTGWLGDDYLFGGDCNDDMRGGPGNDWMRGGADHDVIVGETDRNTIWGDDGTQLIAAERTGRRCCAVELDPVYCDVAVRRWELATGRKAILACD
ncbi:MAG: calcium-binding protein [Rhodobacterales bacterium]|nr:calcium-binding protein [Rhodobacterales bacterium]